MNNFIRKRPFPFLLFTGLLALPVSFLLGGCHPSRNNAKSAEVLPATVSVGVSHPRLIDFPIIVHLPGTILPYQTADINAQVTGYLKSVRVDIGDRVRRGDILADISVPELTNHFVKSLADFQYHQILLERYRKTLLSSPDLISTEEVDLARNKYLVSLAELRKLANELQFSVIRAPFSGIITRRYMDPGALVGPLRSKNGAPASLFRLDDLRKVRVLMDIPQRYVNDIRKGTPAILVIPGKTNRPAKGEIALISHALNPDSKTMPVQAIFKNPDGLLKPGMFIRIRLLVRKISGALTIPDKALLTRNSLTFVYVVDRRGIVQERRIQPGEDNGTNVEILKGLSPGDLVVVSGKHQVLPGDHPAIHPAMTQEELKEETPT